MAKKRRDDDATFIMENYEIVGHLGSGAFASLIKAKDKKTGKEVVLKLLPTSADPESAKRFKRQGELSYRLHHKGIVSTLALRPNLQVREFIAGESFAEFDVPEDPESVLAAVRVARDIAKALTYLHEQRVIHRDIKPENIVVKHTGRAVLMDFGLAGATIGESADPPGEIVGTLAYMSPERLDPRSPADESTDVYALGASLYRVLTGHQPFQGHDVITLMRNVRSEEPVRPTSLNPLVPRELETTILSCLSKDPADRPTASSLARDLNSYLQGADVLTGVTPDRTGEEENIGEQAEKPDTLVPDDDEPIPVPPRDFPPNEEVRDAFLPWGRKKKERRG